MFLGNWVVASTRAHGLPSYTLKIFEHTESESSKRYSINITITVWYGRIPQPHFTLICFQANAFRFLPRLPYDALIWIGCCNAYLRHGLGVRGLYICWQ